MDTADDVRAVDAILSEREPLVKLGPGSLIADRDREPQGAFECAGDRCKFTAGFWPDFWRRRFRPGNRAADFAGWRSARPIYARSAVVVAAAAAHVQAIDGVWVDFKDSDGLMGFARQSRQLGFSGMSLIHPSQVEPINKPFSPTPEEIDYANEVLSAFEEANERGDGSIAFGGQLIDRPIVERARRTFDMAKFLGISK